MQVESSANAVTSSGSGTPVVLVHGFGCDQTMWDAVAPILAKDHEVIRYDLTGFGNSDYSQYSEAKYQTLHGHADDLVAILEALGRGPVAAVGHSVSAIIVGLAAAKRPELFSKLVMIGANPCYIDDEGYHGGFSKEDIGGLLAAMRDNFQGWSGQLAGMVAGEGNPSAAGLLNDRFCRNDPTIAMHFANVTFLSDHRLDLAKIPQETLLIQCSKDAIAPKQTIAYVESQLPASKSVTLDGFGHAPHMTEPVPTATAIHQFLVA